MIRRTRTLAWMFVVTITVIDLGYAFADTGRPLGEFDFRSQLLTQLTAPADGNQFTPRCLRRVPVPLPADFVRGVDRQRSEFEQGKRSYLAGRWRHGSWIYYYAACALWKIPDGCLLLLLICFAQRTFRRWSAYQLPIGSQLRRKVIEDPIMYVLATGFATVISLQTGFGHHFRYAFPCLPFIFIYASSVFTRTSSHCLRRTAAFSLLLSLASSLCVWPQSHSYFNSLAHVTLDEPPVLESNLEWGEDLDMAAAWMQRHPSARPVFYAVMTDDLAGIMPLEGHPAPLKVSPGWYIVSLQRVLDPRSSLAFLHARDPDATLGESLRVYHVSKHD